MRVRIIVAVGLIAATVRCGAAPVKCGEEVCTAEQRCTSSKTCVTDLPPTLSVDAPLEGAVVNSATVEVKGKATDDDGVGLVVDVSSDDGSTWMVVKPAADGAFSVQLMLPMLDSSPGKVTVRARDSHSHEVRVSRALQVDNTPPVCAITFPADGASITSTGTLMVAMTAFDGSLVLINSKVSTDGAATFGAPTVTSLGYGFAWPLGSENGVVHEVVFRIDDATGHTCEAKATVTVDNVKPTIVFTTPAAGSLLGVPFFTTSAGLVGGTANDGMRALKSVTLDFGDGAGPRPATLAPVSGMSSWQVHVPAPAADDYKPHTAIAVVTDLADNTASASLTVTVDVKPPVLTITSPTSGAKLNIASFPTGNNTPLTWTLTDGDSQLNIGLLQADGGFVSPPVLPTSPSDNPKAYQATLRANDRAGNTSTASLIFTVDRVAPTVTTIVPANDTRMWAGNTSADFSEPMMGGNGFDLNPNLVGTWTTAQHYEVTGLAKDVVYSATSGTVTDLHGNPVVPRPFRFHTETWSPQSGALLLTGYTQIFEVTSDSEGTINLLAKTLNANINWVRFDPANGTSKVIETYTSGSVGLLVAARTVQPDLSSRRLVGVTANSGTGNQVHYSINGGAVVNAGGADAFVPTPAFAGEGAGLAEYGVIGAGAYKRGLLAGGTKTVPITLTAIDGIHVNDNRWQIVQYLNGGIDSQDFGCPAGACSLSVVKSLGGSSVGFPNSAASQFCSLQGYQATAVEKTTMFRYQPGCGAVTNPCAPDLTENNNFDQVINDAANDGTFFGYNIDASNNFQIKKRVLSSTACAGAITDVNNALTLGSPATVFPRLLSIRGVPGFIYPSSGITGNVTYLTP